MSREQILKTRYLKPGETEHTMYQRVSTSIFPDDERKCEKLYQMMSGGVFLPNSPTLTNAGCGGNLSACYVVPTGDSLEEILTTVSDMATIHKMFGGTGFNLGVFRPKDDPISTTGGKACGPVSIMRLLNQVADTVRQGGKREGANMGVLPVWHPDIMEFIVCKQQGGLTHFNISVGITDSFMEAVVSGDEWPLTFNGVKYDTVDAQELFKMICDLACLTGDPGLMFLDTINNMSSYPVPISATNPCGEQPLPPNGACNLGSLNLSKFVNVDEKKFDMDKFINHVEFCVEVLDRIIDINVFPTADISEFVNHYRPIGLGIMGWADTLRLMEIDYTSDDALTLIKLIGEEFVQATERASHTLGEQFGCVPGLDRRNTTLRSIAPTGTLAMLAGCSWGIEPYFGTQITKDNEEGSESYTIDIDPSQTALQIPPDWHVAHLAAWQQYIDCGVSKTINLPASATPDIVEHVYGLAWKYKCKGVTVYRDGSCSSQPVHVEDSNVKCDVSPATTVGVRKKLKSGCGHIRVECDGGINTPDVPYEVIVLTSGGCKANNEAIGKVISKYIHDPRLVGSELITVKRIVETLQTIECNTAMRSKTSEGKSCPAIVGKFMTEVWLDDLPSSSGTTVICPECGTQILHEGGCSTGVCPNCGWGGCV